MDILIWGGAAVTLVGFAGIIWVTIATYFTCDCDYRDIFHV